MPWMWAGSQWQMGYAIDHKGEECEGENRNSWLPCRSLRASELPKPGKPQRCWSVRRGPGPTPSNLRALENVVQGIPNQTNFTLWLHKKCRIECSTWGSRTSCEGKRQISMGKQLTPTFLKACESRAVPAKNLQSEIAEAVDSSWKYQGLHCYPAQSQTSCRDMTPENFLQISFRPKAKTGGSVGWVS